MELLSKFAERLKEYMDDENLNAPALAKKLGVSRTSISELLRGNHYPSTKIFIALCEYFHCSADYLIGLTDYPIETEFLPVKHFGERFRRIMCENAISQYRIEKELKISGSIVYCWLNDKSMPNVESLIKLSRYLDCSLDLLLGRID